MKTLVQETFENEFNEAHYKEFVKNLFNHFDFSKEYTLKHQFNDAERQALNDFTYFGTYEDAEKKSLDVLTVELKSSSKVERARSLQRNLIGKYLKANLKDSALVAFYSKDNPDWRLSFVKMEYKIGDRGAKVEIGTPPKRYSFLVGKYEPSYTAKKQLQPIISSDVTPTVLDVEKAFSIEKVTKEFYNRIAEMFTKLVGGERKIGLRKIVEKGFLKLPSTTDDTVKKEFAVRLIGRLLFCWFLKKKKSDDGVPLIPSAILSYNAIAMYSNYYHSLLEPLFFQVLNTPVGKRDNRVSHDLWNKIPFLNGGLFEPHQHDFYEIDILGTSKHLNTLKVPDEWFAEVFRIFEEYNFTIDESSTIDIEISVDPEMLGRIFENLLAEINPQTGETARKSTGSYYTPRPIVEYMVDESLKQYLLTQVSASKDVIPVKTGIQSDEKLDSCLRRNDDNEIETKISKLLSYGDYEIDLTESEKDSIIDALDRAKIIDPACGSGAFPMGILHKMLLILQKIDPESKQWLSKKLARIDNEILRKELEKKLKTENWDYVHKLGIIQNSIYGVDIQAIAVEISKLRFFLSLIVDEKIDDDKPNRGVVPLPNLEFKFVAANSLIGLPKADAGLAESHTDIERLKELRDAYFTSYGDEKRKVEKRFSETQKRMFEHALNWQATSSQTYKLSEWNPFSDEASSWFDPEWMFGIKNPSPLAGESNPITPSPLTGEGKGEGGFDIVIANPPYVRQEDIKDQKPILQKQGYEVYNSTSDIYTYFYEKAHQVLGNQGVFCFITSNKFMRAKYGEKLRKFLQEKTLLKQIIDFGGHKVFESATVDTCIVIFEKQYPTEDKTNPPFSKGGLGGFSNEVRLVNISDDYQNSYDLAVYITEKGFCIPQSKLSPQHWTLADDRVLRLKEKIEKIGTPLIDWDVRICFGIKTGFNNAFIIDTETQERLCKEDPKSAEVLKPILRGRDISRYSYKWAGLWLIKIESGWTNEHRDKKDPGQFFQETYPAVYGHLKSKGDSKGKGKGLYKRDDQGDYWWELRDCNYYSSFENEKIIYPVIGSHGTFCYDSAGYFHNDKAFHLTGNNLKLLNSILNSKLVFWYLLKIGSGLGKEGFEFRKIFVEQLPIPKIPQSAQQPFITIVDQILSIKQKDSDANTSALERQIDKMVYKLYGLTEEEIKIVEKSVQ